MPIGRTARPFLLACAVRASLIAAPQPLPAAVSFDDLLGDLTSAVVRSLAPDERVQVTSPDRDLARDVERRLAARGVRGPEAGTTNTTVLTFTCAETISDRVCAAQIVRGGQREVVSVERRRDGGGTVTPATDRAPAVLEVRPLLASRAPILDLASNPPHLYVLHPSMVARYQRAADGWQLQDARAITSRRVPQRDPRGRVIASAPALEVFLPGASCTARIDSFDLSCADDGRPWPVDVAGAAIAPGRNYFVGPDGERFFAVAGLGRDAGARWLMASADGRMMFLDDNRKPIEGVTESGDDIARVSSPCASGTHVLLPVRGFASDGGDGLRLFHVTERRLIAVTPPVALSGVLTALWPAPGATSATAVSYNAAAGLYEAFHIGVSCGR